MNFIKANHKRIVFVILIFAVAFLGGAGLGKITDSGFTESILEKVSKGKVVNILLMGIDSRNIKDNSRSDTMILASIDTKNKKVVMVWIPRDTRIVSSSGSQAKINSVNLAKGPEAACETVGQLLGTKVDYYVITNFWGFGDIIDTLGGVDIDVETNMKHYDPDPFLNINIPQGQQHLNGENALKYVRYRGGPTADIGRTERQAKFLKAVAKEAFQSKTILKLPELVPKLANSIRTNIPMSDLAYLATSAKDFENSEIITQTLPGYSFTDARDGASYWEADKTVANGIIDSLLAGKTYDVIHDPPSWVTKAETGSQGVENEPLPSETEKSETDKKEGQKPGDAEKTGTDLNKPGTGTENGTGASGLGTASGTAENNGDASDGAINELGPLEPDQPANSGQSTPAQTSNQKSDQVKP